MSEPASTALELRPIDELRRRFPRRPAARPQPRLRRGGGKAQCADCGAWDWDYLMSRVFLTVGLCLLCTARQVEGLTDDQLAQLDWW
jgi:hypothetical protein